MVDCPNCGQANEDGTPLCRQCGEKLPDTLPQDVQPQLASGVDPTTEEILVLLRVGRKIDAIKLYRERHNVDLLTAKEAVEKMGVEQGVTTGASGCLGLILIGVFLVGNGFLFLLG